MRKKGVAKFVVSLWFIVGITLSLQAQETSDKKEEEKSSPEKKAVTLLEQVMSDSVALKLPENRIQLQLIAADLLWTRNEGRARSMFEAVAAGINEMMRSATTNPPPSSRGYGLEFGLALQLRHKLVASAAEHNSTLAYQLLLATRVPATSAYGKEINMEANMEQALMLQIARHDPQMAVKHAEEWLEKKQYPFSLMQVISELHNKDKEAAAKLMDKLLKQLQSENLLTKPEASGIVLQLLRSGPRPSESASAETKAPSQRASSLLSESAFRDLLEQFISAALKGTAALTSQRSSTPTSFTAQEAMQREQETIRMFLATLQMMMPQIEKYLPARVSALRQKITQLGMSTYQPLDYSEVMQQGTSETLLTAAATAPEYMKVHLYQQAATKAVNEGNLERARQIVNDHAELSQQGSIVKMIEAQQVADKGKEVTLESIRQALARIPADEERFEFLIELAGKVQTENAKLAIQLLEEAQKLVSGRARSYEQFSDQLQVAAGFTELDVARSFEIVETGIHQLNEMFPAAALLNGFDVYMFRDGEMMLSEHGGSLPGLVIQYGERIARLAQKDFEQAVKTADKFQLSEARLFVRLAIARDVLSKKPAPAEQ